jgi:16S rRNA (uracil1498-N3)-methyltransferase
MPRDRFFISGIRAAGERVELAPDDARKLVTVLRRRSGDRVQLVDAGGTAFPARLDLADGLVHAILDAPLALATSETGTRIVIAQAIPKGQKMDFIVEKATELGVAAIVPVRSERVQGERTAAAKLERWQRIAKAAAQQAGRARVPSIEPLVEWAELCAQFAGYDRVYLAYEGAAAVPLRARFEADAPAVAATGIMVVVGPEGGLAPDEVTRARARGALEISLGRRILRTETAALVVLAALLYARAEL